MTTSESSLAGPAADVDAVLDTLEQVLGKVGDGDLHLAHPDGGWTSAQVVSHIAVCTLIWLGDLERLRQDPELRFFYREEIGHDATGYPPPTAKAALGMVSSVRRTLATCLTATDPAILDRSVEIPDLGTMTVTEWTPIITGHLVGHANQVLEVLKSRGALPEGF